MPGVRRRNGPRARVPRADGGGRSHRRPPRPGPRAVRRMRCPALDCEVQTFREQVPGVLDRYQRRISRLTAPVSKVARELAGRASARLLPALGIMVSRRTALRVLLKIPCPG
jgi:hypothetical protein